MKKLICIMICLLIPQFVLAEEKKEMYYRYYYVIPEFSKEFYESGKNTPEYPEKTDIWIYDKNVQTSFTKPDNKEDILEETTILEYQEFQKIRYIIIDETYSNSKINLQEIEVWKQNEKIGYRVECNTCSSEFFAKVQNTLIDYEYNYINNNTKIILDLQEEYFPNDLELHLHVSGAMGKTASWRITANKTKNMNDAYYRNQVNTMLINYANIKTALKDIPHETRLEEEVKEIRGVEDFPNGVIQNKKIEYTYYPRKYLYKRNKKQYIEGYYKDLPGLQKDETDFKEVITNLEQVEEKKEDKKEDIKVELPCEIIEEKPLEPETIEKIVYTPQVEIKEVPIVQEKIKYQVKEKEIPKIQIEEKYVKEKSKDNLPLRYFVYMLAFLILKRLSFFKG